tara:strand:+ start:413 stop:1156 length:744 start_codon:yes stop_codon:yes gene_type:complete
MAVFTAVAAGIGAAAAIGSTVSGISSANKQRRSAQRDKNRAQREIDSLKKSRQSIVNPYAGVVNLSSMAKDLSGQMSNPFASLGVATSAAEIQIEEADIALANTLDILRATGASAGGATALAQAALQSKKGVAASIEQQEARNEEMKARGDQALQQQKISEQQRLQNISISEGQRVQTADAAGKQFVFQTQEDRTNADLDRASGQQTQARQSIADANAAKASAVSGGLGALGSIAGSVVAAGPDAFN